MQEIGDIDRVTFEIMRHRIWRITDEMSIALKRVSGSTTTTEANDFMVALYTPIGEIAMAGWGVTWHVATAGAACKYILRKYSADKIHDGDVFLLNDPYIAAFHQPDVYLMAPIYCDGELIAWSGNFTHMTDFGGIDPGGFCPSAREVFHEGIRIPCIKLVNEGEIATDIFEALINNSREPEMVSLDLRSQLAANNVARERTMELVRRYGLPTFKKTLRDLIRYSEILLRSKLAESPRGVWSSRSYLDIGNEIYKIELALRNERDKLVFDFTGTSKQAPIGVNCTYAGTLGSVFASVAHLLGYDIPWNEGILRPVSVIAPEGSLVNCKPPAPVSMSVVGVAYGIVDVATHTLSKMLLTGAHARESTAVWSGSAVAVRITGKLENGRVFISGFPDHLASGGGATPYRDGVNTGGAFALLKASCPNVETYELYSPLIYLFRRQCVDSGGAGKYRGGVSGESCIVIHNHLGITARLVLSSIGAAVPQSLGLAGGYPGCTTFFALMKNANIGEQFEKGIVPDKIDDVKSEISHPPPQCTIELSNGDAFYWRWTGGGGYGDPIERDPTSVAQDFEQNLISRDAAYALYGVVIDESGRLNREMTASRRREIIRGRLSNSGSSEPKKRGPKESSTTSISESLVMSRQGGTTSIACGKCLSEITPADEDWKAALRLAERSLRYANPLAPNSDSFVLREYYCPSCGALIDAEIAERGDGPLADRLHLG